MTLSKCIIISIMLHRAYSICVVSQDNMVKANIDKKFSAHYDAVEAELKSSTVGKSLCCRYCISYKLFYLGTAFYVQFNHSGTVLCHKIILQLGPNNSAQMCCYNSVNCILYGPPCDRYDWPVIA